MHALLSEKREKMHFDTIALKIIFLSACTNIRILEIIFLLLSAEFAPRLQVHALFIRVMVHATLNEVHLNTG